MGGRPARRGRTVLWWTQIHRVAAGVRAVPRHHHCRGDDRAGYSRHVVAHAGARSPRPARAPPHARAPCHHPRPARHRPWRCGGGTPSRRGCATARRSRSAGAFAACAIGPARWRPRRRQGRVLHHGRARGHPPARFARPVHRGAARRRCGRRRADRGRGAEAVAVVDLGLACGAGFPLRAGRLDRRAEDSRQRSRIRPDRQGQLSPPARRAA